MRYDKRMPSNEEVKQYWDRKPCNVKHSAAKIGTVDYVKEVGEKRYFVEPHILDFAKFQSYEGKKVLEIGSGIGTDAISFASHGAVVYSGDISSVSIDIAKKNSEALNLRNVFFFQHDFQNRNLPIAVDFDLIYSFGVIHHSPDPQSIFNNLKYWAKPTTEIKIMVYHRFSTKAIALYLKYGFMRGRSFDQAVAVRSESQKNSPYTFTYTKKSIKKALNKAGLEVIGVSIRHIFPYAIREYKKNVYVRRWYWRAVPQKMIHLLGKSFGWHLLVVARIKSNHSEE